MKIDFEIAGVPARFVRNDWTGRAELVAGDETVCLQSPRELSTHFDVHTARVWRHRVGDHEVAIEVVRRRLFGGLRPMSFTVSVDGAVVAEATGK
ncbi:MAG TPA: hypothetical protein VHT75_05330 [Acidimicrobiales bacterium]|nr:hypothetical protein [Acidimicrobiales bacterium]